MMPTYTYDNNQADQDWFNPLNWDSNIIPDSTVDAIVGATCILSSNAVARSVLINSGEFTRTASETLTAASGVTIESDSDVTAAIIGNVTLGAISGTKTLYVTGNITVTAGNFYGGSVSGTTTISGGDVGGPTLTGAVTMTGGGISGGTINGALVTSGSSTISGGTINGAATIGGTSSISGGDFSGCDRLTWNSTGTFNESVNVLNLTGTPITATKAITIQDTGANGITGSPTVTFNDKAVAEASRDKTGDGWVPVYNFGGGGGMRGRL